MLQFITNEDCRTSIPDQIKGVIAGGCRWVQIRMKNASDEEIRKVVEEVKPLCEASETFLILNDRVELAKDLNVGGVHLGKTDMLPSKARLLLGPAAVIGVTANTFDDILAVRSLDIDYIGMGPFAYTDTKKNLAPVLGIDGISSLCKDMKTNNIDIASVAVGGISKNDVKPLLETGINGIAVSGAIAFSNDIEGTTRDFISLLPINE